MSWCEDNNIQWPDLIPIGILILGLIAVMIATVTQNARQFEALTNQSNQVSSFCKDLCKKSYTNIEEILSCIEKCEIKKEE